MIDPKNHPDRPRTLARSLGMFFGHIVQGFKADPTQADPQPKQRRTSTHEKTVQTDEGQRVTLRRTVIEEIEISEDDTTP